LLPGASLCYKPFMRKWMRERLKRRKKKTDEPAKQPAEPAQAPLRPAYFDAEESAGSGSARPEEPPEAPSSEQPAARDRTESQPAAEAAPASISSSQSRRRRRRGRGGRGRQGARAQQPPAPLRPASIARPLADEPSPIPASAAAAPIQSATPKAPKGVVVLAIGLPGSGKSSWFKRHNLTPLSSDLLRSLLFDDPTEQRFQDLVFSNLRSMLKARLIARRPMNYVDATNLSPNERHSWIKMAHDYGYEVHAVFFDVPTEICMERNQRRERVVPADVMHRMAAKLRPPAFEEGFAKITVVRVKKKEQEQATN
jgi:predicted kinase